MPEQKQSQGLPPLDDDLMTDPTLHQVVGEIYKEVLKIKDIVIRVENRQVLTTGMVEETEKMEQRQQQGSFGSSEPPKK